MKKPLQRIALIALALLSTATVAAQTFTVGDFEYTVLDAVEKTVSIKAASGTNITGPLTIPATEENEGVTYKVTTVAYQGFYNHQGITSITFEGNNLVEICNLGFKDTQGVTGIVTIPASVKSIGVDGFCRCFADDFVFANGSQLESLGEAAFWECKFTLMPNLPNTLTTVGRECFKRCPNLTEAWLPSSVTKIEYATFAESPKIATATISANVTEIGDAAFWHCDGLTQVTFEPRTAPLKIVSYAFRYCGALTSIDLPDQINEMGERVFDHCESLASAHFPTGMTVVPTGTFDFCYAMASVSGLDNVTRLEYAAFGDCRGFTSFTVPAGVEYIGDYALCELQNCETITFAGNNVTTIGREAFRNNKKMESISLPTSVMSIGAEAFKGSKLTSFDIPAGVTIGTGLFIDCTSLASVTFPEGITEIPDYTFQGCSALAGQFTIPASVTRIGQDAFRACNNITEVVFPANSQLKVIDFEAFYMDPNVAQLERFMMPNTVTTLGNGALRGCKKLDWENFNLSPLVTNLPGHTFCDCGFTEFHLEKTGVRTMDHNVFDGNCFTEFHLPANVTYGNYCFGYCHKLERFYFEDGSNVQQLPYGMFYSCENLTYIYLPVTTPPTLGSYATPDHKQIFMDVPAVAIPTYKSTSGWTDFKYALTLDADGTTDLALDDATIKYWGIWDYNGHRYLYNDQATYDANFDNNLMSWIFNNTVEKEYSLLFNAGNRYYNKENDYLQVSLVKYNADGTTTTIESKNVKIDKANGTAYAYPDIYDQVLISFENPLEVGKYAVTFKRLGDDGKFVWNARMVPTADICVIETDVTPAGAGTINVTGDLIQIKDNYSEVTLTAVTGGSGDWISFANWTVDGAEVGTSGNPVYTFTPDGSTKFVANYAITPQNIPADLAGFDQLQAVLYPANPTNSYSSIYWYPNTGGRDNYVYIHDGNSITYFVKSTKPALYNLKFKTSRYNSYDSSYIVDVMDAEGNVIFTKQNDIAQTTGWYDNDMNQENVAITTPLMPNEVYSVRFTFVSDNKTAEIANLNFVEFEVAAIVPETIELNKTEATVKVEFEEPLAATLATSTNDAISEGYDGIVWTTSDAEVATVDAAGKVTAVAPGEATITAKAAGRTDVELTAACVVTVPQHVTAINVPAAEEMYVGNVVEVAATVAPENAADKSLTWATSDESVVAVDAGGKLTAKKAGEATITVTAADRNKLSKTIAVTVHQPVTGITLDKSAEDMLVGRTMTLAATVAPTEPAPYNKNINWTSTDEDVATVEVVEGVVTVTAVGKGTANIVATAADGQGATAQCAVTVTIPVASITLPAEEHIFAGKTLTLTPTIAPANADNKTVTWSTSDAAIATVDDGVVTAVAEGSAVITATAADGSGVSASTTINVTVAVTVITLNATDKTMLKGETFTMTATTNADATDKTVTWTSDNEAVATVSDAGVVTAMAGGVANITATANDGTEVSATCAVTVDVPVTSITLDQTSATVYKDVEIQLSATVNPEDATVKTVTWTTSNAAVASVTSTGLVKALSSGDAVITVKSTADETMSATFSIHVMSASAAGTGANQLLFHEEVNDSNFGDNCIAWDNASSKKWVANSIVLSDANAYTNPYNVTAASLTYTRNFKSDNWTPLYVPFNMSYDEWSADAQVAELAGIHMYDDGRPTIIEFITVKSGDIKPNTPYVIKPNQEGEITFTCSNKTLAASPAEGSKYISCGTPRWTYKFFGNYQSISPIEESYFIMDSGKFSHPASDATLSPMRFYIVKSHSDNGYWDAPVRFNLDEEILIMIDGNVIETSGIFEVIVEGEDGLYYDLNGRVVTNPSHGFYIHNGQKIYIK